MAQIPVRDVEIPDVRRPGEQCRERVGADIRCDLSGEAPEAVEILWGWFGVNPCSDRGRTLRSAAGLDAGIYEIRWSRYEPLSLGDAGLLHSRVRTWLVPQRDALVKIEEGHQAWRRLDDGCRAEVRGLPARPVVAAKGIVPGTRRAQVAIGFGEDLEDASFFMLTIPDAHELVRMLEHALAQPIPAMGP